jgi:hypothetical protein
MLRKSLIALVASVTLGAGVAPGIAAAHSGGFHGGGAAWTHGDGFHGDHGPFHGGEFHHGWRDHGWWDGPTFGFAPYAYLPYDSCWQPRHILTPHGWRWMEAWACG